MTALCVFSCGQYEWTEWLTDSLAGGGRCSLFSITKTHKQPAPFWTNDWIFARPWEAPGCSSVPFGQRHPQRASSQISAVTSLRAKRQTFSKVLLQLIGGALNWSTTASEEASGFDEDSWQLNWRWTRTDDTHVVLCLPCIQATVKKTAQWIRQQQHLVVFFS